MPIKIEQIEKEDSALEDFLSLPERVYANDRRYCPTNPGKTRASLFREAFRNAQLVLLARHGGRPAARLVARRSPTLLDDAGAHYGTIGYFEALDDTEAVAALFQQACEFLHDAGAQKIIGPMDGDTWHRYRLNVGPFKHDPFLMEPYNPDYYQRLWLQNGFECLDRYYSQRIHDIPAVITELSKHYKRALTRGFVFREIRLRHFEADLDRLYELTTAIFNKNFLYTDISRQEFCALYVDAKPLLDTKLIWLASGADGKDVGFVFALPDCFRAVAAMNGQTSFWAKLRFLWHKREADAVNIKTLGVTGDMRGTGVAGALMYLAYKNAYDRGFRVANACLIREGNPSGRYDFGQSEILRRYELYEFTGAK